LEVIVGVVACLLLATACGTHLPIPAPGGPAYNHGWLIQAEAPEGGGLTISATPPTTFRPGPRTILRFTVDSTIRFNGVPANRYVWGRVPFKDGVARYTFRNVAEGTYTVAVENSTGVPLGQPATPIGSIEFRFVPGVIAAEVPPDVEGPQRP
jgi:hypothetical protein